MGYFLDTLAELLGIDLGIFKRPSSFHEGQKLAKQQAQKLQTYMSEPGTNESAPELKDTTNENIETSINGVGVDGWQAYMENQQQKQWEREDQIRMETQEREDTAYQRAVADMQKAGINPNLMNVNPASSGGGITSATGMDYTPYVQEMNKYLNELEIELDQKFKEDENGKDRLLDIIGKIIQAYTAAKMFKK